MSMALVGGAVYGAGMGLVCGIIAKKPLHGMLGGAAIGVSAVAIGILFGSTGFYFTLGTLCLLTLVNVVKQTKLADVKQNQQIKHVVGNTLPLDSVFEF